MQNIKTVCVLGAGAMAWGIAYILETEKGIKIRIWDRDPQLIAKAQATGQNSKNSVPEIKLKNAFYSTDMAAAIAGSDLLLLGVPSFAVREMCRQLSGFSLPPILMISKGMEEQTSLLPFQIVEEVLGKKDVLHLTGAGYGKEVHKKIPSREALAAQDPMLLKSVQSLLETDWLAIKPSTDLLGAQLAGALKNVLVIGFGLAENKRNLPGLRANLVREGIREMTELGKKMGAKEETFQGPAGKGDLVISADPLSRNYRLGQDLSEKGIEAVRDDLTKRGLTAEGFHTAFAVHELARKYDVELPILEEVYQIIYEGKNAQSSADMLAESYK